ncbi:MAG: hydrogenase expression/formation protein HypE [candidate division WOR-3 bacterium]
MGERVRLGHGSGGVLSARLVKEAFLPLLGNPTLDALGDSGVFCLGEKRVALTTDSFVVRPIFFPGGDIGKLSASGTINDLAVSGARPLFLTGGFVLEEGLDFDDLARIVGSFAETIREVGATFVAGDTKVIEGSGGIIVNTAGFGELMPGIDLSPERIEPGDRIIVTGTIGDHGFAVLLAKGELGLEADFPSDCAPVWGMLEPLYQDLGKDVKFVRDPTRGGLATVLNEACRQGLDFVIRERDVPVRPEVAAASELLGLDPLYAACEGRAVVFVSADEAERAVEVLKNHPLGSGAALIGEVTEGKGMVVGITETGGKRVLDMLAEDQYPRIC